MATKDDKAARQAAVTKLRDRAQALAIQLADAKIESAARNRQLAPENIVDFDLDVLQARYDRAVAEFEQSEAEMGE